MRPTLEPLDLDRDLALLHAWVTHPRSAFWMMQGASRDDVAHEYRLIVDNPHHDAWLGRVDGVPVFLAETYDPRHVELAGAARPAAGRPGHARAGRADGQAGARLHPRGIRRRARPLLRRRGGTPGRGRAGRRNERIRGDERARSASARSATDHPACEGGDLVVPDPRRPRGPPGSRRAPGPRPARARASGTWSPRRSPSSATSGCWSRPTQGDGWAADHPGRGHDVLLHGPAARARPLGGRHGSRWRLVKDEPADLDAQAFVVEFAGVLGIPDALLPTYLEELASTLASAAWKLRHSTATARRPGRRRLPDPRGGDDRGTPVVRGQQRPDRVRPRRLRGVRTRDRQRRSGWSGWPRAASSATWRSAPGSPRRSCTPASWTPTSARACSAGSRDLGLDPADYLLAARAPVAVAEQDRDHVRTRPGPARPGAPRRGARTTTARSSRSAPSSTPAAPSGTT